MNYVKIILLLGVLLSSISIMSAVDFYDMDDIITNDSTPNIPFRVVGNVTSYISYLFINDDSGNGERIYNNTLSSINSHVILEQDIVYQFKILASNFSETPIGTYSSIYNVTYTLVPDTPFTSIIELITDIPPTIIALKDIIIVASSIIILFVIVFGLKDSFEQIVVFFRNIFKR